MIKFDTINGQIYIILEKPEPLTKDAKFPCVVRLIQDDSLIGMHTSEHSGMRCKEVVITGLSEFGKVISNEKIFSNNSWPGSWFEVICYHVEEGSKEWALWQMMRGMDIFNMSYHGGDARFCIRNGRIMQTDRNSWADYCDVSSSFFPPAGIKDGWQLYEPEPLLADAKMGDNVRLRNGDVYVLKIQKNELRHGFDYLVCGLTHDVYGYCKTSHEESPFDIIELIPEPQFKVGDWVELGLYHNHHGQIKEMFCICEHKIDGIEFYRSRPTFTITGLSGEFYYSAISRKLKPSEVVIQIGCLSGTVIPIGNQTFMLMHNEATFSTIRFDALDDKTRSLVESLLKAQAEEK